MKRLLAALLLLGSIACTRADAEDTPRTWPSQAAEGEQDAFARCVSELMTGDEQAVRERLVRNYRLSTDDAHDLVRDALMRVCIRHAERPYASLAAALETAASNRAKDGWRHRRRYLKCPFDDRLPSCTPSVDDSVRFAQEERALEAALCQEDRVSERVVRLRIVEGMDFAAIGREHEMTADQARAYFHNAMRRIRRRFAAACPS